MLNIRSTVSSAGKRKIDTFSQVALVIILALICYSLFRVFGRQVFTTKQEFSWDAKYFYILPSSVFLAATFTAFLAGYFVICIRYLKRESYILLMPLFMILGSGNGAALVAILIQIASGLAIGLPLYDALRDERMPKLTAPDGAILAWFIGLSVNAYITWIALHWPINFSWTYYIVAFAEIAIFRGHLQKLFRDAVLEKRFKLSPGQRVIVFWGILILPYFLCPIYLFDECVRHIFFPKQVFLFAKHVFSPSHVWALDTELFSQSFFTTSYLFGGEAAMRLINGCMIVATFILFERYIRRVISNRIAYFSTLALVSTPMLSVASCLLYLEVINIFSVAAFVVFAIEAYNDLSEKALFLAFSTAAIAYLFKQQSIYVTAPTILMLGGRFVIQGYTGRNFTPLKKLAISGAAFAVILAPFLIQNYVITKNPLFPWYNNIFHSPFFEQNNFGRDFNEPLNFGSLYNITFHGEKFTEYGSFQFGINFFLLAWFFPFILFRRKSYRLRWLLTVIFVAAVLVWWMLTSPNMRYFVGPLLIGSILQGLIIESLWCGIRQERAFRFLAKAAVGVVLCANALFFLNAEDRFCRYPILEAFSKQYSGVEPGHIAFYEERKRVFALAAAKYGKDSSCLLASTSLLSFADQRVECLLFPYWQNSRDWSKCKSVEDAFNWIFRKKKFSCVILGNESPQNASLLESPDFLKRVNVVTEKNGLRLLEPKSD